MTWRYRVSLILALHLLYIIESGLPITALTVKVWRLCFFPFCQGQSNEQLTSTPEKDRSFSTRHVKHDLTPKSKCGSLPASKRRQIGVNFVIQFFGENNWNKLKWKYITYWSLHINSSTIVSGRSLNSREIRSRQDELYSRLKEGFEEREGASTDQSVMLEYLNLGEADKSFLTRGVKEVFPSSELRRTRRKGGQLYPFKHLLLLSF